MAAENDSNKNDKKQDDWFDNVFGSMFKQANKTSSSTEKKPDLSSDVNSDGRAESSTNSDFWGWMNGSTSKNKNANQAQIESAPDSIDATNVETLSIKELRDLIKRAGLSDATCFEKSDLIVKASLAKSRLKDAAMLRKKNELISKQSEASSAAKDIAKMHGKHPIRIISGLECTCVGERNLKNMLSNNNNEIPQPPDYIIFCFHGYQATGASLAPLGDVIRSSLEHSFSSKKSSNSNSNDSPNVLIILPQSKGSGWWNIDFTSYAMAMAMGEAAKGRMLRTIPSGVQECRKLIHNLIDDVRTLYSSPNHKVPMSKIYFMGFSQGAMLALDTALHCDEPVGGVVLVSGFLMDVDKWAERLSTVHRNIKVLQLHGLNDPLIPFGTAQWLQALLNKFSTKATFVPHGGGHDIPPHVLTTVCGFLSGAMLG